MYDSCKAYNRKLKYEGFQSNPVKEITYVQLVWSVSIMLMKYIKHSTVMDEVAFELVQIFCKYFSLSFKLQCETFNCCCFYLISGHMSYFIFIIIKYGV